MSPETGAILIASDCPHQLKGDMEAIKQQSHALQDSIYRREKAPSIPLSLPSLMLGGAVFSFHYNANVQQVPTEAILSRAIEAGANGAYITPYQSQRQWW
jgi:hypothetical protein